VSDGYEVHNPQVEAILKNMGEMLKRACEASGARGAGFALLIFHDEPRSLFYTSSANRQDVIKAMREFITKYGAN
jgi:hypothetical protein